MSSVLLVLAVIRDPETKNLVRFILEGEGHRVIQARDYLQASALLQNGVDPDLVLVEPDNSNPDDREHCRVLALNAPASSVCLILGIGEQRLLTEMREFGIRRSLTKPVTRQDLETLVGESGRAEQIFAPNL